MSTYTKQMLEAAFWTFLQTFIVVFAAGTAGGIEIGDWTGMSTLAVNSALAAFAAVLSLIKSLIVKKIGAEDSTLISGGEVG